ncbi:MAG: DNA polymerase III subunit delta [Sedimentisphaerales bacterium]|nr:DNA polymerase III subunit delta [Sedimentisphaerales bacterium]
MQTKTTYKSSKSYLPVYVIAGKDASSVNAECDKLLDELIGQQDRATGLSKPDADKASVTEVFDELRTLPFLAKIRVVVIKQAGNFISNNRQLLENYLDKPASTGVLVMTVDNLDARTKFAKKLNKTGKLITVSQPSARELPARLKDYASQAHGKQLASEAAMLLVEFIGDQLPQLYNEIDKLAVYTADKKQISVSDVDSLTGHNRLYNLFDVINSVIRKDTANALNLLRQVFSQDKSAEYTFVGAFAYHLRRMFTAKAMLLQGISERNIAEKIRIWYDRDNFFEGLKQASLCQIGTLLEELADLDYQIKTGRKNVQAAAEELVMRVSVADAP